MGLLNRTVFSTDAFWLTKGGRYSLEDAQAIIEEMMGEMEDDNPVVAEGFVKRWDGNHKIPAFEAKSPMELIGKAAREGDSWFGYEDEDEETLSFVWTHHDGYGILRLRHSDGRAFKAGDLWIA